MAKNANIGNFWHVFAAFRPRTGNKTSPNYLFLVEEVLSFNLVGHMWKLVKNWLQKCIFYLGEIFWIFFCIFWNCLLATSLSNVKKITSQQPVDVSYTTSLFEFYPWKECFWKMECVWPCTSYFLREKDNCLRTTEEIDWQM